jgi:dienelactone hydrolase
MRVSNFMMLETFRMPVRYSSRLLPVCALLLYLSTIVCTATPVARADDAAVPREIAVSDTFDGQPFSYRVNSVAAMSGFSVHYLTYPSPVVSDLPQNNTIPAELYLPDGSETWQSPRPAVICMHILDGDFQLVRMTCSMLASRGIPALMFKLPYYGERGPEGGTRVLARRPDLFAEALKQARTEIRRTVDVLASRPEIDGEHIGITGISLGAIVAATGAAEEPRLRRVMLVLGGGDLLKIILHAEETDGLRETIQGLSEAEQKRVEEGLREVDPLTHAAKLRDRAKQGRIVMVNAAEDNVVPRHCTERLAAELGIADDVVWLEGLGHYTAMAAMPKTLERTVQFFGQDLPSDVRLSVEKKPPTSVQIALEVIQRAATLMGDLPAEGRCHVLDASVSVTDGKNEEIFSTNVFFARDRKGRFKLDAETSLLGRLALGGGSPLWFLAKETLMQGTIAEPADEEPLDLIGDEDVTKIRTVAGALKAATMAPGIFEQLFAVADETTEDGQAVIHVARRDGSPERLRLVLDEDRKTVREVQIEWRDGRAVVKLTAFQANAPSHDGLFRPVQGAQVQEVSNDDLRSIFRAVSDFGIQSLTQ